MYGGAVEDRVRIILYRGDLVGEAIEFESTNPVCGDVLRFQIQTENNLITSIRWKAQGCPPTLAAADILAEKLQGTSIDDARRIKLENLLIELPGLPRTSKHALQLTLVVLRGILEQV